jgi:hypothetical protein
MREVGWTIRAELELGEVLTAAAVEEEFRDGGGAECLDGGITGWVRCEMEPQRGVAGAAWFRIRHGRPGIKPTARRTSRFGVLLDGAAGSRDELISKATAVLLRDVNRVHGRQGEVQ